MDEQILMIYQILTFWILGTLYSKKPFLIICNQFVKCNMIPKIQFVLLIHDKICECN